MLQPSVYFRVAVRIALIAYFAVAALVLGLRYVVLPNADHWRPEISARLSAAVGMPIQLGEVSAEWRGLNPSVRVRNLDVLDANGNSLLHVPSVEARLGWRSVLAGGLQFVSLDVHGLKLRVLRDRDHRLHVLGQTLDLADASSSGPDFGPGHPLFSWLMQQRQMVLRDAALEWVDESRQAPPLRLEDLELVFMGGSDTPRLSLRAAPPEGLGRSFEAIAQLDLRSSSGWDGRIYTHIDAMVPGAWRPWLDVPAGLESGNVSAQWWLDLHDGEPGRFVAQSEMRDVRWVLDSDAALVAQTARIEMAGVARDYKLIAAAQESAAAVQAAPVAIALQAQGLELRADELFEAPLRFDTIDTVVGIGRAADGALEARLGRLHLVNPDMDVQLQGGWRQGGSGQAGLADITGRFKRASIAAIDDYLPTTVNLDARQWLAKGLVEGVITDAAVVLKGDLEEFPFGADSSKGDFLVAGRYSGAVIDYLPAEDGRLGWPRLTDMDGKVSLHRVDLRLIADEARVWPLQDTPIVLRNVLARIPNIEEGSVLTIQGETQAPATAYLALTHVSPLGRLLDGQLDEATGAGDWRVPLWLRIPLLNSDDTTVQGSIVFDDAAFRLMPEMPEMDRIKGQLDFSEKGLSAQQLSLRVLGGQAQIAGAAGGGGKGLELRGQIESDALARYVGLQGMRRLRGRIPYRLVWRQSSQNGSEFIFDSNLVGLQADLPEPWSKDASQARPLTARWARSGRQGEMALNVNLDDKAKVVLLRRTGVAKGPFFQRGVVAVGQAPTLPDSGLRVDVRQPYVDMDTWRALTETFSQPLEGVKPAAGRPVLPMLRQLDVHAGTLRFLGLSLEAAAFSAQRATPTRWSIDLDSRQTTGTVLWDLGESKGKGSLQGHFKRLALGSADEGEVNPDESVGEENAMADDALDDIPSVKLDVETLVLFGRHVGSASVEGANQDGGSSWRLDKLHLASPSAELNGSGLWRLRGPRRGLTLDAKATISDLGAYMAQLGLGGLVTKGKGTVAGRFEWRNLPWRLKLVDLNGDIDVKLQDGRFSSMKSRTARVLELLSLQSLRRLVTLDINPASAFRDGFPFDSLSGTMHIADGHMSMNNYRVSGPVGTINLGGDVDLEKETLKLQALVLPNLDMSGATLAAGIAINPIVGLGAFLTQWLLRDPLSKAMSVRYKVDGNWDDPKLTEEATAPDNKGSTEKK